MANYLKPHSAEWFAALDKVNPVQAGQTREILSLAGRDDVCSICGGHPAADYRLPEDQTTSASANTLRLCQDCVNIRREIHGEKLLPLGDEPTRQ
jgi:hypothetical protein